jgi:hypothetical protein
MKVAFRTMAMLLLLAVPLPALAHGDHDARPLLRHSALGHYTVSLWQVYPDVGSAMTPHLIVMFDDQPAGADTVIAATVNSESVELIPSMTTPGAWETVTGVAADDVVTVTVSDSEGSWSTPTVVIPPPLTSMLPMRALIALSIFLATAVAWWIGGRAAQAWRRPITYRNAGLEG